MIPLEFTLSILLIFMGCIGTYAVNYLSRSLIINKYSDDYRGDWIIDRVSCEQGEVIRITVTNLDENRDKLEFKSGEKVYSIESEDGILCEIIEAPRNIILPPYENYSWLWYTDKATKDGIILKEGLYRIKPYGWDIPLRRSIFIRCHCSIIDRKKNL